MIGLALLLALTGVQQDQNVDLRVPGTFRHGAWQGRCFRDGFLSGMDHELCRGWTNGPVAIHFERTAEAMRVSVSVEGCRGTGHRVDLPAAALARTDRVDYIALRTRLAVAVRLRACHSGLRAPMVEAQALAAVLTETDGLEAGSMK